jgi:hypothetical protein
VVGSRAEPPTRLWTSQAARTFAIFDRASRKSLRHGVGGRPLRARGEMTELVQRAAPYSAVYERMGQEVDH